MERERHGRRDTDRTEAFSDGIFAFAITLLILNLRDPVLDRTVQPGSLFTGLEGQWPSLFALCTSFATILIMWVNHHNMFNHISHVDTKLMFLNGLLLFFVVLTPFTTLIASDHVLYPQDADARTAALLYSAGFFLLAMVWGVLWRYGRTTEGLLAEGEGTEHISTITRRYYAGPAFYGAAVLFSEIEPIVSLLLILAAAIYFAIFVTIQEHS